MIRPPPVDEQEIQSAEAASTELPVPPVAPARGMGDRAATGFVWLMSQTLIVRLVTTLGQFVLASLLTPEDFGDVGLALTVHAFASILQQGGLNEILVKRHARMDRWSNPAFWMSLTLGVVSGSLMVAFAPIAAWAYDNDSVARLLVVLAISMIPAGLIVAPEAKLSADLRFKALAVIGVSSAVSQLALSVVLARLGMGGLSMVLPRPIVLAVQWVVEMWIGRPRVLLNTQWRLWKFMVSDNITLVLGKLCLILTHQGDYIILGLLASRHVVGLYYFAFSLSMQTMTLITTNLGSVLFPVLSKVDDPKRQTAGFLRAARILALIGVPMCLLQAALAGPVIRAIFPSWNDSIPLLQILSVGMALRLVGSPAGSLFNAQGRFRTVLILNACYAVVFLAAVTVGALVREAAGVAIGASIYFAILGPVHMYVAIRPGGGTWRDVGDVYIRPVLVSAVAITPFVVLAERLPDVDAGVIPGLNGTHAPISDWLRIAIILGGVSLMYVLLARWLLADRVRELVSRFGSIPVIGPAITRMHCLMDTHRR